MHRFHYFIISACMLFTSCNKDEVITEEVGGQPIIELDSETGIYTVKVDHELTIAPTYQNVEDALFAWTIDGTLVSSGPSLQRTWNECGDFYVKLSRAVGKSVPVRGCLLVRRGREFDNVGHRFHDLYAYVFRCCPIYIGSVDCHRINTEFFFIESISILGGNDFSFPYPFDFEPFDIRMLNIGSKCVIGIPDDF